MNEDNTYKSCSIKHNRLLHFLRIFDKPLKKVEIKMNYYINTQEFARDRCLKRRMKDSERDSNRVKSELFCIFISFIFE